MIANSGRFTFYRILLLIALLIWLAWLIKIFKIDLSFIRFNSLVITGSLLIFMQCIIIGIKKGKLFDIKISEFKKIAWKEAFFMLCAAVTLSMSIVFVAKSTNHAIKLLKTNPSKIIIQLAGGFVSGMIGFVSAMGTAMFIYHYQQKNKHTEEVKDHIEKLFFELTNNMIAVKGDLNIKFPFKRLETSCWNAAIASKLPIKGWVKGRLLNLYGGLSFYNEIHETRITCLLQNGKLSNSSNADLNNYLEKFAPSLYEDIKNTAAIFFGEIASLGYREEKDWGYPEIDWKKIYEESKNVSEKSKN